MNQPENNPPENIQPDPVLPAPPGPEEWLIPDELLSCSVNKEVETSTESVDDDKLKWFQMQVQGGETEVEKREMIEAQREQLKMGILRLPPQPPKPAAPVSNVKIQGTAIPADILNGPSRPQIQQKPKKLGPNDKCSCGSGKKYKVCCLRKQYIK